jgi:hypothetical protein
MNETRTVFMHGDSVRELVKLSTTVAGKWYALLVPVAIYAHNGFARVRSCN